MKKGFTMIELIFSIVIIAIIFTVIPKIIYSFNKSDSYSIREDALFNGISVVNLISRLPWDEKNTIYNDILHTQSINAKFDCNSSTYRRIGGFVGSRNCEHDLNATAISSDGEGDWIYFNDIDDFNDINISSNIGTDNIYTLANKVTYIKDGSLVFKYDYPSQTVNIDLNDTVDSNTTTNLKRLQTIIYYSGKRGKIKQISQLSYVSANIGQTLINKRAW